MADRGCWETFKAETGIVEQQLKRLLHEGNARRVIVTQHDRVIAEFPMTVGVVGIAVAPVVAAVGAIVALLHDCTIHVERRDQHAPPSSGPGGAHEAVSS